MEHNFIYIALENLEKATNIKAEWKSVLNKQIDGELILSIGDHRVKLNAEVKQGLRNYQLNQIFDQARQYKPFIFVAERIFPKIKEELRFHNIAYLEANGNIFLKHDKLLIWLDGNKPIAAQKVFINRAFTKTGIKVIFHFLLEESLVNRTYREIAKITQVGVGNINYILNGLKEMGFLVKSKKHENKLINKKELLEKWMIMYEEKLKPDLEVGAFRFLHEEDFINWKRLHLIKTWWGGEPAGDLFTDHLRPEELTIYTNETRSELIKHYRLIPDKSGKVKAFKKFWHIDLVNDNVVPPLLVYADLVNKNDKRCRETAQMIYDKLLKQNL